ncbi:MAG: GNAT family N-acetyltransferase [Candidatus Contendobacter sp.]|nr:GNAT family N-acetyltransferase [Candidatus Contendobacter sp.]MDG4556963.1 GNAT family N-acetyltransferase [Candidatus Contendobacter sp.]
MSHTLRNFSPSDADAVNRLALRAFEQFRGEYSDWEAFSRNIGSMASLSTSGELIVASDQDRIVGAVVYVGPHKPKREFFSIEWPILRMLVVDPAHRGQGIGRVLTQECINRAQRDSASVIALHTSPIMQVALPMYLRMGFMFEREAPSILGVSYGVYIKRLHAQHGAPADAPKAARR